MMREAWWVYPVMVGVCVLLIVVPVVAAWWRLLRKSAAPARHSPRGVEQVPPHWSPQSLTRRVIVEVMADVVAARKGEFGNE